MERVGQQPLQGFHLAVTPSCVALTIHACSLLTLCSQRDQSTCSHSGAGSEAAHMDCSRFICVPSFEDSVSSFVNHDLLEVSLRSQQSDLLLSAPLQKRHSLSPASFTRCLDSLPCGQLPPRGRSIGLTLFRLNDTNDVVPACTPAASVSICSKCRWKQPAACLVHLAVGPPSRWCYSFRWSNGFEVTWIGDIEGSRDLYHRNRHGTNRASSATSYGGTFCPLYCLTSSIPVTYIETCCRLTFLMCVQLYGSRNVFIYRSPHLHLLWCNLRSPLFKSNVQADGREQRSFAMVEPGIAELEKFVAADLHRELLARILVTDYFSRAPRLQRFLTYITECYLQGNRDEITEQQIGVHVFDKPPSYNPGDDNAVRSYARTLRKRLEEYFANEGCSEPLVIQVPRGGYVPVFVHREVTSRESANHEPTHESGGQPFKAVVKAGTADLNPALTSDSSKELRLGVWIPVVVVICLASCMLAFHTGRQAASPSSSPAVHSFWSRFSGDRRTIIVPSDTGLTVVLGLTKSSVSVPEYVTGAYVSRQEQRQLLPDGWDNTNVHRYTDLIDVKVVSSISRLPEIPAENTSIRYARDLRVDDLTRGNAVLIGGTNANPWVQLFDKNLTFALEFAPQGRTFIVKNRQPRAGEPMTYPYGPDNWSQLSYGLVAVRPSLDGKGYVLVIEGVAAAGLQGAAEYLLKENTMAQLTPRIFDLDGRIKPFELLLRTNNVGSNAVNTEIIGFRLD